MGVWIRRRLPLSNLTVRPSTRLRLALVVMELVGFHVAQFHWFLLNRPMSMIPVWEEAVQTDDLRAHLQILVAVLLAE